MFTHIHPLLDSPVLHRELIRVGRKAGLHVLRYGLALFLIFQMLVLVPAIHQPSGATHPSWPPRPEMTLLDVRRAELLAWTAFWGRYTLLLLQELFWWIVLITPAMTAGALGHEKERGTLLALFGTQLYSSEIVIGKMLGRLFMVMWPALTALPFLVLATVLAGQSFVGVFLALGLLFVVMLAIGAASMVTAVWTRRTTDAILACYASLVIFFLGGVVFLPDSPLTAWLAPGSVLEQIVTRTGRWVLALLYPALVLGSVAALCLALAIWRLRPACIRQQDQRARRWLWAYRRPLGNDPIAWRERHAIGLAPVPWLRLVPTWMGRLGVFCFSAIIAYDAANYATSNGLYSSLQDGNLVRAFQSLSWASPDRVQGHVHAMGAILAVGGTIIIGVRCSNAISEEKRRKTWEDLILTPLTRDEIMAGKRRGILYAAGPPFFAYALPMVGLAALEGGPGLARAAIWLLVAGFAILLAAFIGISWAGGGEGLPWDVAARLNEMILSSRAAIRSKIVPANEEWALAKRHDALPVHSDTIGVLLLRSDGQVLEAAKGANGRAKPANSYRWLVARVSAARRYPELRVLLPRRPKHADSCAECGGSGLRQDPNPPAQALCRGCTGLGWVYVAPPPATGNVGAAG